MTAEIDAVTESAKAVQEVAKTGQAAIEAFSDLGRYLAEAFGTVPEDFVGLAFGDRLRAKRLANALCVFREAFEGLSERNVAQTEEINLKHLRPLIEAISEESDETLQEMWARLLTNAMDPNSPVDLERTLIDTLRQLEPHDAVMLNAGHKFEQTLKRDWGAQDVTDSTSVRLSQAIVSLERLAALKLVEICGKHHFFQDHSFRISCLGQELFIACSPSRPAASQSQ